MEGKDVQPPAHFRDYLLASAFGYTPAEIDDSPATRLDWLLACHGVVEQVKREAQRG